jgi:hypothetical protein
MISIIDPRELQQVLRPTVYAPSPRELPSLSPQQVVDQARQNIASFVARDIDRNDRDESAA